MPSWQASVLNRLLTYVARPSVSRGSAKVPLCGIRRRLLEMDRRWLGWPQELKVEHWPLSHSPLIHYQLPQPREVSLFYIRGGGFCFKTPHAHARFLADIMRRSLADCYVPDYRLAPEHPFPAACDDVLEAYRMTLEHCDPDKLVLMGDSAGGNLALSLLVQLKQLELPLPRACVLLSPALDLGITGDTERILAADDPLFTIESLLRLRGAYLAGSNPMSERVSPLYGCFKDLPPILLLAGTRELLLQDAERLQQAVLRDGGRIEAGFYLNMPHVFPLFELLPEAMEARGQIAAFIRNNLLL
ncbi:MAG: alpha/beta hydrolase [Shewanella algae]